MQWEKFLPLAFVFETFLEPLFLCSTIPQLKDCSSGIFDLKRP